MVDGELEGQQRDPLVDPRRTYTIVVTSASAERRRAVEGLHHHVLTKLAKVDSNDATLSALDWPPCRAADVRQARPTTTQSQLEHRDDD